VRRATCSADCGRDLGVRGNSGSKSSARRPPPDSTLTLPQNSQCLCGFPGETLLPRGSGGEGGRRPDEGAFDSPLFDGIPNGTAFYFVNSYAAANVESEIARADYGGAFTAAVQNGRVFGVQFHPEKSSTAGLRLLRNYVEKVR